MLNDRIPALDTGELMDLAGKLITGSIYDIVKTMDVKCNVAGVIVPARRYTVAVATAHETGEVTEDLMQFTITRNPSHPKKLIAFP